MQSPHVGCTGKQRIMGGPWNRRHVHRSGIKPLSLVQHMGPKHIGIMHCQHGVVVYGANQTKPGGFLQLDLDVAYPPMAPTY